MMRQDQCRRLPRRGVTSVEFAMTAPILFLLLLAAFEFSRVYALYHTCEIAAAEGARRGIVPGATAADCQTAAADELTLVGIKNYTVTVSPSTILTNTETISVTANVPVTLANGYILPRFFLGKTLSKTITLPREQTIQ